MWSPRPRPLLLFALGGCVAAAGCNTILDVEKDYVLDPEVVGAGGASTSSGPTTSQGGAGGAGATCTLETCSGNGTCDDAGATLSCTCDTGWDGEACDQCATGYTGDDCAACDDGFQDKDDDGSCLPACDDTVCGEGLCDDESGTLTCQCKPGFQGADCATACRSGMAGAACDFRMIFALDIPVAVASWSVEADVGYALADYASVTDFDRIGYRMILDDDEVWAEVDAFVDDAEQIGIPVDWKHDLAVENVTVVSFAAGLDSILTPTAGYVEMWDSCYSAGPNGNYDVDDDRTDGDDCYGSFQLHVGTQTIFAFNRWSSGNSDHDLGIGNSPMGNPDWTFQTNAANYTSRRVEVYVREP